MMRRFGSAAVAAGAAVALLVGAVAAPGAATEAPQAPSASPPGGAVSLPAAAMLPAAVPDFTDVDASSPFAADIAWLAEQGITTGYADGSFRPLASVNRDAMAAFLYRLVVGPEAPAACAAGPFTDVPATHPFCPQISWLVGEGVTTGWADGTYRPASAVSREAMAAFLYRVGHDGADAPACTTARFSDVPVSSPFCGEIAWLAEQGVTTGWPDGTFRPGASIERQAMAAFLHRYALLTPPEEPVDPDAPQVSIDEPLPGSMVGGTVTVTTSWLAVADLARLDLLVDGEVVATAEAEPYDLTWDTTAAPDGAHELTVVATDAENRTGTSEPVGVVVHQGPNPVQTLEDDYTSGAVTPEEYARYAVYRWFEPELVPEEYRVPEGYGTDLTEALMVALRDFDTLDPDVREELRAYLSPEGVEPLSMVPLTPEEIDAALAPYIEALSEAPAEPSPTVPAEGLAAAAPTGLTFGENTCYEPGVEISWRFPWSEGSAGASVDLGCLYATELATFWYRVGWATEDVDVLDGVLRDAGSGGGPNGVPDSIDEVAAAFFHASWVYERLGFPAPSRTNVAVGDFDNSGFSAPLIGSIFVDGGLPSRGRGGRVYLTQHELFHQFQYPYVPLLSLKRDYAAEAQTSVAWWLEATAEWGTHQAQRDLRQGVFAAYAGNGAFIKGVGAYANSLDDHIGTPGRPLSLFVSPILKKIMGDDWYGPQYGAFLFAEHLDQLYGQGVIHDIWQRVDSGDRPVDAIAAELEARGTDLPDVVAAYHRANVDVRANYSDPDSGLWAADLDDGRAGFVDLAVPDKDLQGDGVLGAGGAAYLEFKLDSGVEAAVSTVTVDLDDPAAGDHIRLAVTRTDSQGAPCDPSIDGQDVTATDGQLVAEVLLLRGCTKAQLVLSNDDPRLLQAPWGTGNVTYDLSVTSTELASLQIDWLRPYPASDKKVVAASEGHVLLEDSSVASMQWNGVTDTGLTGVTLLATHERSRTSSYAIQADGDAYVVGESSAERAPALDHTVYFATNVWGTATYALRVDGIVHAVLGASPALVQDLDHVIDIAGDDYSRIDRVTRLQGYAVTDDGGLFYLLDEFATEVPGVTDAAQIEVNDVGDAFVVHADGRVSMLLSEDPLVLIPVEGIEDATQVIATAQGPSIVLDGPDNHLFFVDYNPADMSTTAVVDSGVTGIDRVIRPFNSTTTWVLDDDTLIEITVPWSGSTTGPAESTALWTDIIDAEEGGCRYAMHSNGSVSPAGCGGGSDRLPGLLWADSLVCALTGPCYVNFD